MAYKINTFDPTAIDHMVTLLKSKIERVDCKQIIQLFLPAVFHRIIFQQNISTWYFLFALHHSSNLDLWYI